MTSTEVPRRGEIWLVAFGSARKGEPGKNRPAIVLTADELMEGRDDELILTVPLSSSLAPSSLRPPVPATAGIDSDSAAIPRGIRGSARSRLLRRIGEADPQTLGEVERALRLMLSFDASR